ncbi:hypothetical protein JL722_3803 [Aureococcus anophagefferens]|nr:hypothetical protein JL722_3803 [Aureococcus anophagefferens]
MTDASENNASDGDDDAAALKPQADGGASSDDEDARASKKAQKKQRKKDKKEKKKKKAGRREGAITAAAFFDVTPNDAAAPPAAAPAAREAPSAREAMEDKVQLLVARGYDDAAIVALLERDGYRATVDAEPAPAPAGGFDVARLLEAEVAAQLWRASEAARARGAAAPVAAAAPPRRRPPPSRARARAGRGPSYDSRSRSRSPAARAPHDPRNPLDPIGARVRSEFRERAPDFAGRLPHWDHDAYETEIAREPSPERALDGDYEPPQPEWFSRAGGVYIKNPRAWLNEPRERHDDDRG